MNFTLRTMQATDLDMVLVIAAAAPDAPQWPRSAYEPYVRSDPDNPALLRVALVAIAHDPAIQAERILAFACATLLRVPDPAGDENLCQLDTLAVHPGARRCGIGAALLRALLAWADQNGARHFALEVRASNAPAIAFYQRIGLCQEGRRPRYYAHPEEDALLLGISVTAGTP